MSPTASDKRPHDHVFDRGNPLGERNTWRVVVLTAVMMLVEVVAGYWFNSMALLADGWHMGTHVAALGLTAVAYVVARRHAADPRYTFGAWKLEVLAGYTSAVVLVLVALYMAVESVLRLLNPRQIRYDEALIVAVIGLVVNLASAFLLHGGGHDHGGGHGHDHGDANDDLNLRAAYLHVLTDALTSVLAIAALLGGRLLAWGWLDPMMGLVGAGVILVWSRGLLRDTGRVLLDREMDHPVVAEIREALEAEPGTRITDLHVWRVGRAAFACVVCVSADGPLTPDEVRARLAVHEELVHVTVEIAPCPRPTIP